jgi:hypothetical protein
MHRRITRESVLLLCGVALGLALGVGCAGGSWNPFSSEPATVDASNDREAAHKRLSVRQSCIHMAELGRWDEALEICREASQYYPSDDQISRAVADAEAGRHH